MKQTVTSKYEPKSKNVTWIDMSTGHPVLKNFINGMWRPTGGGGNGAGSTNPTEADATKVWQVTPVLKETKTEETVIVPEQTLVDGQDLEYNDKFVLGAQCVAVVNGVEYRGEVVEDKEDSYIFEAEFGGFVYNRGMGVFQFYKNTEPEVTAKLSVIEETPTYDYNWAPGVKIPIPIAEDEGKILVVTKVEGDNTSIIVPEQPVPININETTPLTGVDLTKFVVGNNVKVTITPEENDDDDDTPVPGHLPDYSGPVSESGPAAESELGGSSELGDSPGTSIPIIHKPTIISQTITATGVIEEHEGMVGVPFNINDNILGVWQTDNSLYTSAGDVFGPNVTIKLEYIESNYEYQLQENSGSGGSITVDPNNPPTELEPNTIYNYGTLNDNTTFPQLKDSETDGNVYCWFFWTSSPVPEITVPENLIWANGTEPVWSENKYYEITVMNNIATCLEV